MTESGIMTYDEIKKFAEEGRECQMLVDNKWVKLNLEAVIHEFRLAPILSPTPHDGRRVLRAALYYLERFFLQIGDSLSFAMPKTGPKTPWTVTGDCWHNGLRIKVLKDVFKTYFRISEEKAEGDLETVAKYIKFGREVAGIYGETARKFAEAKEKLLK